MTHALRLYFPPAVVQRGKRMDSAFAGAWTGALPKAVLQFSFPAFAPLPISPYAPLALPDAAQRFMQSVLRALHTQRLLWQAWHLYFRQISQIQENIMATAKTPSKKPAAKAEAADAPAPASKAVAAPKAPAAKKSVASAAVKAEKSAVKTAAAKKEAAPKAPAAESGVKTAEKPAVKTAAKTTAKPANQSLWKCSSVLVLAGYAISFQRLRKMRRVSSLSTRSTRWAASAARVWAAAMMSASRP